jgi:hypothetical protein
VKYLQKELVHGLKREQAPPIGWRGHRTSQTRGYLVRPAALMREEAKRSLRSKRALHAVLQQLPDADAGLIEELLEWKLEQDAARAWSLAVVHHGAPFERTDAGLIELAGKARAAFEASIGVSGRTDGRADVERASAAGRPPARSPTPPAKPPSGSVSPPS